MKIRPFILNYCLDRQVFLCLFVCLFVVSTTAQRDLTGSSYVENFDSSRLKLPSGWTIYRNASQSGQGSSGVVALTEGRWDSSTSGVYSFISGNQSNESGDDYSIGILSSGSSGTGDPGASFQVTLKSQEAFRDYKLSFRLQTLNISKGIERTITWKVQCQKGSQSWMDLPTGESDVTTVLSTSRKNSLVTVDMGTILDDYVGVFSLRIVTLNASSGGGYRPISAIDDFALTYKSNKQLQTILFDPLPLVELSDGTLILKATSSSGLPVTYSSSNLAVATISGSVVILKSAGETILTASQVGSIAFSSAVDVQQILKVVRPSVSGEPTSIAFGSRLVGKSYTEKIKLTTEYLKSDLVLSIEGEGFSIDPPLLSAAFEKQQREVIVTFSPSHSSDYSGVLSLMSSDISRSTSLSGRAFSVEPPVIESEEVTNHSLSFSWNPISLIDEYRVSIDEIKEIPQKNDQTLGSTSYVKQNDWSKSCHDDLKLQTWVLNSAAQYLISPEIDFSKSKNQQIILIAATEGGNYTGNKIVVYLNDKEIAHLKPTKNTFSEFVLPLSVSGKGSLSIRTPLAEGGVGAKIQSVVVKGDLLPSFYLEPLEGSPFSTQLSQFSLDNLPEKAKYKYDVSAVQSGDVATSSAREVVIKHDLQLVVDAPIVDLDDQIHNVRHLSIPLNTSEDIPLLRLSQGHQSIDNLTLYAIPGKNAHELKVDQGASLTINKETCVEMDFSTLKNQWVFLSLPFDLNIVRGIRVVGNEGEYIGQCEVDYAFRVYDSERRSQGGVPPNWWNINQSGDPLRGSHTQLPDDTDVLARGHGFIFFVPQDAPSRYRFYADGEVVLADRTTIQGVGHWQVGQEANGGWRLLGNPTLTAECQHESFPRYVYHHNPLSNGYFVSEADYARLSPLHSYFVQLPEGGSQLAFSSRIAPKRLKEEVRTPEDRVVISLFCGEQKWDETTIVLDYQASGDYPYNEDALTFNEGNQSQIATLVGSYRLAVNRLSPDTRDVPLFCSVNNIETRPFSLRYLSENVSVESVLLLDSNGVPLADLTQTDFVLSSGEALYTLRIIYKSNSLNSASIDALYFYFFNNRLFANQDITDEVVVYALNGDFICRGILTYLSNRSFSKGVYLLEHRNKSYRLIH